VELTLRFTSRLDFGEVKDRLETQPELAVNEVEAKGRLVVHFRNGLRSSMEIWRGGSVAVHLKSYEHLLGVLQYVLDPLTGDPPRPGVPRNVTYMGPGVVLYDKDYHPPILTFKTAEIKRGTGSDLLWVAVIGAWRGMESEEWSHCDKLMDWAQMAIDLAFALYGSAIEVKL